MNYCFKKNKIKDCQAFLYENTYYNLEIAFGDYQMNIYHDEIFNINKWFEKNRYVCSTSQTNKIFQNEKSQKKHQAQIGPKKGNNCNFEFRSNE